MALVEIQVPDIGDFDEVGVIELLVKPGDTVKAEQSLITVESDKASMEIPSSHAGVVKDLRVQVGDKVKQGSVVLTLEVVGAVSESNSTPAQSQQAQAAPEVVATYLTRCLFSMFAEDVELLPKGAFLGLLQTHRNDPSRTRHLRHAAKARH